MKTIEYVVEDITPKNGEQGVPVNVRIQIEFSEYMNKETVEDSERVTLRKDNQSVPVKNTYQGMTQTLTIDPVQDLNPGETYFVVIKEGDEGVVTSAGKTLKRPHTYFFITEGQSVTEPDNLEESDEEEDTPQTDKDTGEDTEVLYDPMSPTVETFSLVESFPVYGDLVELNQPMVFVFSDSLEAKVLQEHIFVKEKNLNPLLERLSVDKLIKGTVKTANGEDSDKTLIFQTGQLEPGKEYQVVIQKEVHPNMANDVRITFHTLFQRMFADVDTVRLVMGNFAERLTDLEIAKLINQQSNSVYQLASMMDSFEEGDWVEEGGIITTFPYAANQYVVYSTAYYAILGQSLETSSGLKESIKLADLSVSGSSEVSDNLSDLLEMLKMEYERWWNVLQGEPEEIDPTLPNPNYSMGFATRSGSTEYPDFLTRVPFEDIGGGDA